ncbi:MAG: LysE family translocator [Rhizobiaceae bacterium]|nr:LysE family translocator [Rhizobiaceae bacterium]
MTSPELLTFVFAVFAIVIVPGPTVTVIIANSLRKGAAAGLMNVAGTQFGLIPMILIVALGLETVVTVMGQAFFWIKLLGAAYLIWLGYKLLRSDGTLGTAKAREMSLWGYFWQGVLVIWSNPKALFFFGAFIPQFVDPASGDAFWQTLLLGGVFIAVATVCDAAYALLAGKAGSMLTRARVRIVEIGSGLCLIGGGIWLAFAKRA